MAINKIKPHAPESEEQIYLFHWAQYQSGRYPELELMYHIPNGGSRNKYEAANLKLQGVKAGVPDICLPVARGKFHGLYIELKVGRNKTSEKQNNWIDALNTQGYCAAVCYGWESAADMISKYLRGGL